MKSIIRKALNRKNLAEFKKIMQLRNINIEKNRLFPNEDYSKADLMVNSYDWNTFYIGMLMNAELSLEGNVIKTKFFSTKDQKIELGVRVSREAQIQMHIWYSILTDKTFLKNYSDYFKSLLINKAKYNWVKLIKITQELNKSDNLILNGQFKSSELKTYKKKKIGKAWYIKQDKSNRFVYFPKVNEYLHEIEIFGCMFHYDDLPEDMIIKNKLELIDLELQGELWVIYRRLDRYLPKDITSFKFRSVIKKDYLYELFKNPNLIQI